MTKTELTSLQRHNYRNLYLDIAWWGIFGGATLNFLSVFLARLNATTFQLGLLSAGPAVVSLFIAMPIGRWLKDRDLIKTTFLASIWLRGGYFSLAFLPFLVSSQSLIWVVLLTILIASFIVPFVAIGFNAMFADLVSPKHRPHVVGRRNALVAVTMSITTLFCGYLLDHVPLPINYQVVFLIGAIGAAGSSYHLSRLRPVTTLPKRVHRPMGNIARNVLSGIGGALRKPSGLRYLLRGSQSLFRLDILKTPFRVLLVTYFFFYIATYFPIPLIPLFLVNDIGLSDSTISQGWTLYYVAFLFVSMSLSVLTKKFGVKRVIQLGAIGYSLFPLFIISWHTIPAVLTLYFMIGGGWGITSGGLINNLMDQTPEDDRPAHMALYQMVLNLGILIGSLLGPAVSEMVGLRTAIIVGGILRVISAIFLGI